MQQQGHGTIPDGMLLMTLATSSPRCALLRVRAAALVLSCSCAVA